MNDIGFGILCFGDEHYFQGAKEKEEKILQAGLDSYILTDNPTYFSGRYIYYDRGVRSYHDKMKLAKDILDYRDICILIDADAHISDYSFLDDLKTYDFKKGITYLDTLFNHPERKCYVNELNKLRPEWNEYWKYAESIFPDFGDLTLMWEYFIVFNPKTDLEKFYETYDKLQIVKEFCDIRAKKDVLGNGEGVSISVAAQMSGEPCYWDKELYDLIGNKMENVSGKYLKK